jgi:plastocyanin
VTLALHPRVRALAAKERAAVLGVALAVFTFAAGPVWRHRWDPDAAILWSYAVIPAGVFAAFFRRGTPRLVPVLLESLLLAIAKFGITAFVLVTLWSFGTPPPAARPGRLLEDLLRSKSTKTSSSERDRSAPGEAARLAAAQTVSVGDGGFSSKVISLTPGGDVAFRATDGRLHAVEVLAADGSILRNIPVLGSGVARFISFEEVSGGVSLRCAIHPGERADLSLAPRR